MGWNNQKPVELWKPDKLSSASAAAVLAKDYKMAPLWAPSADSAGHQAAVLAVGSASSAFKHHSNSSPRSQHEGWGNSAATQAFHANRASSTQANDLSHGNSAATQAFNNRSQSARKGHSPSMNLQGNRSLAAAKGAMASSRPRATSTPSTTRPTESQLHSRAASNALNGATIAHRASMQPRPSIEDTGAVPVTTMTRNMFTSHPMVKLEADEQQNNERLHQSAVEMAKKMYNQQQRMVDQAREHGEDPDQYTSPYLNLQDAAYKQAHNRLAKLHDEHQQSREMQEYYGHAPAPRRRFSVANKLRRKSSDEDVFNDREESARIRQQMSMFSSQLSEVDKAKRQHDRDVLLAAAQRNVKARLHGMDENVYQKTGKVNPTLLSDWEAKAHQAAQERHQAHGEPKGRLDLGGGMFMDQEQIDAIAAQRIQPVLDDIDEKAEKERERLAALKMEEDEKKAELEREREHERESKAFMKRVKGELTVRESTTTGLITTAEEDKQEARERRQHEKAERAEKKRLAKGEKRMSKHDSATSGVVAGEAHGETHEETHEDEHAHTAEARDEASQEEDSHEAAETEAPPPAVASGAVPEAEQGATAGLEESEAEQSHRFRVRGWIKNRFSRAKSIGEHGEKAKKTELLETTEVPETPQKPEGTEKTEKSGQRRSLFRGGSILRRNKQRSASQINLEHRSSSMRDVAMAGKSEGQEGRDEGEAAGPSAPRDSRGVSPVSSADDEPESRSRKDRNSGLMSPKHIVNLAPRSSVSPSRDSRFREEIEK